ncbi:MAG: ankyrin repeat protein, partial [Armatimonadetes bacterium]|nr:ankyrin repeat protein [Armatimonadota bacterium]
MRFESFLLDRLAKAKQLARELSTKRAAQTEWLIAVFLDRLVRAASELEPGTQIARRLDDARNRLLDEVRGLLTDAAWRRQHHQLLESLFAAPAEPQRDAAREVLKVLTARAAAGFAQHPAAGTQFLDTVARLEAAVPTASFAPPPTTPELMLAFLRQVMLAAAERQGKNRRQWEEKTQRYGSLLEAAAAELATDGVSAGVHGQLLRKLFIDPTEPVREDAAKLLPLLVEKARIRLNKEPATGKPHELEAVRTSLTSAFANTHFRLPAPPNPPEVATEERPGEGPGAITPPSLAVSAPVSKAVTTGDEEVADPKLQEKFMRAVKHGALATVRELLAAYPALVHLRDADGDTPLHYAAGKGHTKVLKLLLEFGADVNAQNPNGETPLHQAVRGEQDKVAELGSGLGGPKNQGAGLETQLRNAGGAVQQLAIVEKQRDT